MMTRALFLVSLFGLFVSSPTFAQQFTLPISISDGTGSQSVTLGVDPSGTSGFDSGLDVYAPPAPPSGLYSVSSSGGDSYSTDIRANSGAQLFTIVNQNAVGNVTYSWSTSGLSALGTFSISDAIGGALLASTDMTSTGSVTLSQFASSVIVTITPFVNSAPVANDDNVSVTEDTPANFTPLSNDTDGNGDTLTITALGTPTKGAVSNNNGTVTYTPNANATGSDSFTYDISDGRGGTDQGTVNITITPVNDAPVATDDSATTNEDTPVDIMVLANDTDVEGDALTITNTTTPTKGTVSNTNGTLTYTPNANANGGDTFDYTISDGNGGTDTGTVNVTITSVPDAPVAVDDSATTDEDTPVQISVLANDTDGDGDALTVTTLSTPSKGAVSNNNGTLTYTPNANATGADSFTYDISDGNGGTDQGTVNITITPVNDAPVATDDTATTNEDTPVDITVLANDTDVEGDALTITNTTTPTKGTVSNTNGTLTYTPNANANGSDTFDYTISDGNGGTDTGTVNVTITAVPDAPVAVDDNATTNEDTPVQISVLDNDTDGDGDALTVTTLSTPSKGAVSNNNGTLTYTPNANATGADSFTYDISDGNGGTDQGTVNITITPVNDAPVATDDTATTNEDTAVDIAVLTNDTDVDGDVLTVTSTTTPSKGTVTNNNGTLIYTPNANANGSDTFDYTISDGNGGTDTGTVNVTITAVNDAPVANNDVGQATQGSPVTVNVLANDTDVEGDQLTVTGVGNPSNGTAVNNNDGTVTYTPGNSFNGSDSFSYTISDGNGGTATGTMTISVNGFPVAVDDAVSTNEDTSVQISPLTNDTDPENDPISLTGVGSPTNGTVVNNNNGTLTYTPNANFNGQDSFTYDIADSEGGTDQGTITVTVTAVNDAPVATDDTGTTNEDTAVNVDVLANDTDVDADVLSVSAVTQPSKGTAAIQPDGTITFTPAANDFGERSFSYTLSDGKGGTDTGNVTITVTEVNDVPVAVNDVLVTSINRSLPVKVLDNDTDADGDQLSVSAVTQGANGATTINPDGSVQYAPAQDFVGQDSFTYTVSDGRGGQATGTVNVTVNLNAAPIAVDDEAETNEDTAVTINVLANDSDPDGDPLHVASVALPADGSTAVINDDNTVTFTPPLNFNGTTTFTYQVEDDRLGFETGTVTVTVLPVQDPPTAVDDEVTGEEDGVITISPLSNDSDPDGDQLVISSFSPPSNATGTISQQTQIILVPNPGFSGRISFPYTVSDGNGGTAQAVIRVDVAGVNDAPVAVDDTGSTNEDTPVDLNLVVNDTDEDSATLTVQSVTQPVNGTTEVTPEGLVRYTPNAGYSGQDAFTYVVTDGELTDEGAVVITITAVNDAPVAMDDEESVTSGVPKLIRVLENDSDPDGDALTITVMTQPASGSAAVVTEGTITYTSAEGYTGSDSFEYKVTDPSGSSDTAVVNVTVNAEPVDDDGIDEDTESGAPDGGDGNGDGQPDAAQANVASLPSNSSGAGYVTLAAPNGTELVGVQATDNPAPEVELPEEAQFPAGFISYGLEGFNPDETQIVSIILENATQANAYWKYGPTPDNPTPHWYNFAYDGDTGAVFVAATPTSKARIDLHFLDGQRGDDDLTVNGFIDDPGAPVLVNNVAPNAVVDREKIDEDQTVEIDVLANDVDNDGDALSLVSVIQPTNGAVTIKGSGTVEYKPNTHFNGEDVFRYVVSDGNGHEATGRVVMYVTPVNDAPVAIEDNVETNEDQAKPFFVLANDIDPDGDTLFIQSVGAAQHGATSIRQDGAVVYVPEKNYNGTDRFTYVIGDNNGAFSTGTVNMTVVSVNDAPVAQADVYTVAKGGSVTLSPLGNDSDPDGDTISLVSFSIPQFGTVSESNGTYSYTNTDSDQASDTFTYTIVDVNGAESQATITISIGGAQVAPSGSADTSTGSEDTSQTIVVLANDMDVNGDSLSVTGIGTAPEHGAAEVQPDGSVVYTPDADFFGEDSFTYLLSDGTEEVAVGVSVTVEPVNDAPTLPATGLFEGFESGSSFLIGSQFKDNSVKREDHVVFRWAAATDVEEDAITYRFVIASDSLLDNVLHERETSKRVDSLSVQTLAGFMGDGSELNVWLGVVASDASASSTTQVQVTLLRGFITSNEVDELPTEYALYGNYPNPFNPTTTIRYDVVMAGRVEVKVLDLLGREVAILASGQHRPGVFEVKFDASTLPSGVYLYVMRAADFQATKTMVLIK